MKRARPVWLSAGLIALLTIPAVGQSTIPALNDQTMFGIDRTSGLLGKYDFAAQRSTHVGMIRLTDGTVLTGIDASTHLPRHHNLMTFWSDPASREARLAYVNAKTAKATVVGTSLGAGHVTGAAAAPAEGQTSAGRGIWNVFAVQEMGPAPEEPVEFDIEEDRVVPREPFAARVTVIGAAISYSGQYDMPVTTQLRVGGRSLTPFGSFGNAESGNVNDSRNPRQFVLPNEYEAGTPVNVLARSWMRQWAGWSGWSWQQFMTVDGSNSNSQQLIVLRHGDAVPAIQGFQNQGNVRDFVDDYIDPETDTIRLGQNEAIFLFELGTTSMRSDAADFQDLVVLVTLAKNRSDLEDPTDGDDDTEDDSPKARLVKVNHLTGEHEQLMTLAHRYDSLATMDGRTFYAVSDGALFKLNVDNQSETWLGSTRREQMLGLDFTAQHLMGFELLGDSLLPIDPATGASLADGIDTGLRNLGTIVFMPTADDPAHKPDAYD